MRALSGYLEHVREEIEIPSDGFLQPPPFPLGESPPDTEALVVLQCVLQALGSDLAGLADLLRLPRGAALLRKESLRVGLRAQCTFLPAQIFVRAVRQRDDLAHAHLLLPPIDVPGPFHPPGRGESHLEITRVTLAVRQAPCVVIH